MSGICSRHRDDPVCKRCNVGRDDYREEKWWLLTIVIFGACMLFWMAIISWVV